MITDTFRSLILFVCYLCVTLTALFQRDYYNALVDQWVAVSVEEIDFIQGKVQSLHTNYWKQFRGLSKATSIGEPSFQAMFQKSYIGRYLRL